MVLNITRWFIYTIAVYVLLTIPNSALAQNYGIFKGKIVDNENIPISAVNIQCKELAIVQIGNENGEFLCKNIPNRKKIVFEFSVLGFKTKYVTIELKKSDTIVQTIRMEVEIHETPVVTINENRINPNLVQLDVKHATVVPSASGNGIESMIKTFAGVTSNNELSSQYNVRGGNFDENLVYVNDIEIYRPMLIRSGQQEGLSFINADMVSNVQFSAGGFEAKYGDKMSSVLDVQYRKPEKFGASFSASLLGANAHVENAYKNGLTFMIGARYKSSQYLLNSLETEGEYDPKFTDIQIFSTYTITPRLHLEMLGNIAQNIYNFIPTNRSTEFGTAKQAYNLNMYFDGNEKDRYLTYTGALALVYKPTGKLVLKLNTSIYRSQEQETFDIQSQYYLNELDRKVSSPTFGDSILNLGIGTYLEHARNYLDAQIANINHTGFLNLSNHRIRWGLGIQANFFEDRLNEWNMLDSAGYSLPSNGTSVNVKDYYSAKNQLNTQNYTSYIQDSKQWTTKNNANFNLTAGIRSNFWSYNNQFMLSPRISLNWKPKWLKNDSTLKDWNFRFATGIYYQPPMYKEMRGKDGVLNKDIQAQKSIHVVAASDYVFKFWNRPFKLTSEIYYKYLSNLIPYYIDNIRIRYNANQQSSGYATGLDLRLNGEFVKNVESWASVSFLRTYENIKDDNHGKIPRPSDQLMNVSLFFQDYLPGNESYKVHLTVFYGSRLPFGPPDRERYTHTLRMPGYKRVDVGFSHDIKPKKTNNQFFNKIDKIWISGEIFNLFGVSNVISYDWVSVVPNAANPFLDIPDQFAVPNRLTARRFNIRFRFEF